MTSLEDFVAESIKQIINGVKEAQKYAKTCGAGVAEGSVIRELAPGGQEDIIHYSEQKEIRFDIAVTTGGEKQTEGGIGIFVGPVGLGSKGKSQETIQAINKIQFEVSINFPKP